MSDSSLDLSCLAREFGESIRSRLKDVGRDQLAELLLSAAVRPLKEDIVFQTLDGLSFPFTLYFLDSSDSRDMIEKLELRKAPGIQISQPIPERSGMGFCLVAMIEMALAFLWAKGLSKDIIVAAISEDGRGGAFRGLGGDDIRAWPVFISEANFPATSGGHA